jgi:hypothetical protein
MRLNPSGIVYIFGAAMRTISVVGVLGTLGTLAEMKRGLLASGIAGGSFESWRTSGRGAIVK